LQGEGVDLTAGQLTGSKPLQWGESTFGDMPFSGGKAGAIQTAQKEQFTKSALERVGETADRATPDVIDGAFKRIGNQFETIGSRNNLTPDAQLTTDLDKAVREYNNLVAKGNRAPVIENTIKGLEESAVKNNGIIPGDFYNSQTSTLARQARGATDPYLKGALQDIRGAIDDAMERSVTASGNTADIAALKEARNQYRNLMIIEKAATGAGADAANGLISPSQLRNAVVAQSRRSYARGQGDFAALARSGEAIMKPLPQSGTQPRSYWQSIGTGLGAALGGSAGSVSGGLGGALVGAATPGLLGRALMSTPAQAYLKNQLLVPSGTKNEALVRALISGTLSQQSLPSP